MLLFSNKKKINNTNAYLKASIDNFYKIIFK